MINTCIQSLPVLRKLNFITTLLLLYAMNAVAEDPIATRPLLPAVQPASPESPIAMPNVDIFPVDPADNRFEVRVLARGVFTGTTLDHINEGLIAVHPITHQLYITDFDYLDQFLPVWLHTLPPNARFFDFRRKEGLIKIPSVEIAQTHRIDGKIQTNVERFAFYAERMDVDSRGNVFWIQGKKSIANLRTEKVVWVDSDFNTHFIPTGDKFHFEDIHALRFDLPDWGLAKDDVLVMVSRSSARGLPSQILALKRNGDTYEVHSLIEQEGSAITSANDTIYSLSKPPVQLIRHNLDHPQTVVASLENIMAETQIETPQLEYMKADRAFYVLDSSGSQLIRVSEDGADISVVIQDSQLTQIKASPDGNILYAIVRHVPYAGSIQALYLTGSLPITSSLSALESGDINGDAQSDAGDVNAVLQYYLQEADVPEIKNVFIDTNRDGKITPQDAQNLWQKNMVAK